MNPTGGVPMSGGILDAEELTDHQLLVRMDRRLAEINGTVKKHDLALFGNKELEMLGLCEQAALNTKYRMRLDNTLRVIKWLASIYGATLMALVGLILEGVR